ncbi:MAG: hypothetical protein IJO91_10730 [Oscillospiraceae bacterium]|nr:hypothetical protein [Oscillospiraceae bacterium]
MCRFFGVSRSGYYDYLKRMDKPAKDLSLAEQIRICQDQFGRTYGYRSLHLVIETPMFLSDRKEMVHVEVQIRTIAMDFWASLEHQLKYKTDSEVSAELAQQLKDCAETIAATDLKMQSIYQTLKEIN